MTLPVLGSTVTVVPFAWTEYVRFVDVLLDAKIWKVNICPWVTFSVDGPDSVGGTVSANNDRNKHNMISINGVSVPIIPMTLISRH